MLDPASTVVIANPAASGGRVGQRWDALSARITAALGPVRLLRTERAGHGMQLACQAVRDGATDLLSLGGDGTHNEVVNGIMQAAPPPGTVGLGILPAGTGGDFRRVLSHAGTLEDALAHLPRATSRVIDLGVCDYTDDQGAPGQRWFLNIASCGISGLVCRIANASSKRLGGKLTFYTATLRAMAAYRAAPVRVSLDGTDLGEHQITSLQACNARFAGGGMMFAPQALLDDGQLDLVILQDPGVVRTLLMSDAIYKGTHVHLPHVQVHRGRRIEVHPTRADRPAWVDIDGEAPGLAPVTYQVVPGAIRLWGARPEVLTGG
ncbi:diacylglycerol kinase family lipid kinase [Myxococcota bacterium]|nr:diacylglycerol kinase family lipid kinase [Myxococcota bacterium]